ncbi:MAG: hypothetical protein KAT49_00790 [Methanomicrobia archaeon]|nr:hypothetical protein [Methanomicrobia archaeon]
MKEEVRLFFNKHTLLIFLALDKKGWNYAAKIRASVSNLTEGTMYSYCTMRLMDFRDLGLCEDRVIGRKHEYKLTPKGRKLQKELVALVGSPYEKIGH